MNTQKIRYGIIGFGLFAERTIAPAIQASENSELLAIQKRSLDVAREKASKWNIPLAFDSPEKLANHAQVDAVFIVSANSSHCSDTLAAARAGKHVLVEKPMAMNVSEAETMIRACSDRRVKLMVGHMVRLSPLVRQIREMIASGRLGAITFAQAEYFYDGRFTKRSWLLDRAVAGGGPWFDIGVHCLDTLRFVLDDHVVSVKGHLSPPPTRTRTEKTADLSFQFSKGTLASIRCSYEASMSRSFIEIVGTEGMVSAYNFTLSGSTIPLTVTLGRGSSTRTQTESITVPDLYVEEVTRFSNSIIRDVEPEIPGHEGLQNQRVLDAVMDPSGS